MDRAEAVALVLSAEGRVLECTQTAEGIYGFDPAATQDRRIVELLRGDDGELPWDERLRAGRWSGAEAHSTPEGLRVWVSARLELDPQGQRVLSARALGTREILTAKDQLWTTLAKSSGVAGLGMWIDDRVAGVLEWSPQMRRLFGVGPDEVISHERMFARIQPEDAKQLVAEIQANIAEDSDEFRFGFRVGSEEEGWRRVESVGAVAFDQGVSLGGVGFLLDVERVRNLEGRVEQLEAQLRQAQRMDAVGRLAGGVAHDFNNLLTVILGATQLLSLRGHSSESRELKIIEEAVERASDLTQRLLAFGRKQTLRQVVLEFDGAVAEALGMLRRLVGEDIAIESRLAAADCRVFVDPVHLHQVLANLLVNASQAMPDGGTITIATEPRVLDAGGSRQGEFVCMRVSDDGPGIPPQLQAHVFEPFFTTKAVGEGTGLGLSTVQGIVDQHGGFIDLSSEPGQGTTFELYFPRSHRELHDTDRRATAADAQLPSANTILLVEDDALVQAVTQRILVNAGFTVLTATDGEHALELAQTQPFDLLLTDVIMPRRSGTSLVAALREKRPGLPVLYMSGYPRDLVEARVQLGQRDRLLRKPFRTDQLLREVTSALRDFA